MAHRSDLLKVGSVSSLTMLGGVQGLTPFNKCPEARHLDSLLWGAPRLEGYWDYLVSDWLRGDHVILAPLWPMHSSTSQPIRTKQILIAMLRVVLRLSDLKDICFENSDVLKLNWWGKHIGNCNFHSLSDFISLKKKKHQHYWYISPPAMWTLYSPK